MRLRDSTELFGSSRRDVTSSLDRRIAAESQRDSVPQPRVGAQRLPWVRASHSSQNERSPSPQPSPPGEGARWAGLELFVGCSPRPHFLESSDECLDATGAAISVQAFQNALFAPPLLGERAGVRVDQPLTFPVNPNSHRPRVARQRMRRSFLKLTKDSVANHLRCASQSRIPEPEFFDAERSEKLSPFLVTLALFRKTMLRAVEFNRKPRFFAEKIQRVNPGGMLPTKFVSAEPAGAQPAPHDVFRPSRILAQSAGCVGHGPSVGGCRGFRKNGITLDLTPALSPRRGSATGRRRKMQASFSAFSLFGNTCRIGTAVERGDLRSSFQGDSTRVPSPGGEGQGEGGLSFTDLHLL